MLKLKIRLLLATLLLRILQGLKDNSMRDKTKIAMS